MRTPLPGRRARICTAAAVCGNPFRAITPALDADLLPISRLPAATRLSANLRLSADLRLFVDQCWFLNRRRFSMTWLFARGDVTAPGC